MEKFAVDLDAVLDEFELNEDQAEVAAARLQKQIEQGRLEIASSETTPGSSYTNSPRSSFAHVHDEPTRTVSPLVRPAGAPPAAAAAAALTSANRAATSDSPTNHRPPSDPAANHSSLADALANHASVSAPAANHKSSVVVPAAGGSRAAAGPVLSSSSSYSTDTESPEHHPTRPVNGGPAPLTSVSGVSQPMPAPHVGGTTVVTINGAVPESGWSPPADRSPVEAPNPTGVLEKAPTAAHAELKSPGGVEGTVGSETASVPRAEDATVQPSVVEVVGPTSVSSPAAPRAAPVPSPPPAEVVAETVTVNDTDPRDMTAAGRSDDAMGGTTAAGATLVSTEDSSSGAPTNAHDGTEAETNVEAQSLPPKDAADAGPAPQDNGTVTMTATMEKEQPPAAAQTIPDVVGSSLAAAGSNVTPNPPSPAVESPSVESPTAASAGGLPTLLAQVAAAPSPPAEPPTAASPAGSSAATPTSPLPSPSSSSAPAAAAPAIAAASTAEAVEGSREKAAASEKPEPVRFRPADDMSDAELENYLEQLEGDPPTDGAPGEGEGDTSVVAEEAFGGARPKISPATPAEPPPPSPPPPQPPPEPAGPPMQAALKGGVISRLQSQVSIECEVDSRSARAAAAEAGRGSPPPSSAPPPVRPSSLELSSSCSQPIAEQPEPTTSDDAVAGESSTDPGASGSASVPPPSPPPAAAPVDDDGSSAQESVSTTGGNIVTAPGAYEEARLAAGRSPVAAGGATAARGQLVSLSDEDKNLGKVAPVWVPDEDAVACMECELRFTVIRRRHHCRACGRLLCSACCSERICLDYMEFREGRVCSRCKRTIDRVQQESRVVSAGGASSAAHRQMARPPNPNNPMEYCSTVPPTQQASQNAPPPTVMVPSGVLKRAGAENSGGRTPSREAKQVMFSDGIRPGGDLTEAPRQAGGSRGSGAEPELRRPPHRRTARLVRGPDRSPAAILKDAKGCKDLAWKPESGKLPPVYQSGSTGATIKQSTPEETIVNMIRAERDLPWSFLINKNLMVVVKMFKLDCCVGRTCWIFTSHGLSTVGQEEVVVILESLPDEAALPKDIFFFYHHLFAEAAKGHFVTELGNTLFSAPFLGSKDHGGFLYLRPTFQCLHNVPTPPQPFLVAVLIQKWEAPWAKVFPLRLLLRLGAEFRYYPCPLVSVRHRKPVFYEVGHTIINLLADFRNFAYVLPTVHGMHIHMEEQETSVLIPRNRFNQVLKAINNSNDHVLALGASFSREADSHLVCMQNEDGQYQTQAINIQNRPRQVTGASFVVFNGALKSAAGVTAKSSIVEDGLMFQISPDTMTTLRANLRQMQDFKIECGPVGQPPDEVINIKWVEDDRSHNLGVRSVIDDKPLDGIPSIRVHSGTDYVGDTKLIRWTEVYFIKVTESVARSGSEPPDFSRLAEEVARGACVALTPHLPLLADSERSRIGLRATVERDTVGYDAGSNGEPLPPACMNLLDSELVPVLHRYAAEVPDSPICLELLFHVIDR